MPMTVRLLKKALRNPNVEVLIAVTALTSDGIASALVPTYRSVLYKALKTLPYKAEIDASLAPAPSPTGKISLIVGC